MATEYKISQMEICIKALIYMVNLMEKGDIIGQMELHIKENF